MRWRRVQIVVVGLIGLWVLVNLGVFRVRRTVPPSFYDPPIFFGAHAIATAGRDLRDATRYPTTPKIVSFHAPAEPAAVLAFYATSLPHDEWELEKNYRPPTGLMAYWTDGGSHPPLYSFAIDTEAVGPSQTVVTLTLAMELGR